MRNLLFIILLSLIVPAIAVSCSCNDNHDQPIKYVLRDTTQEVSASSSTEQDGNTVHSMDSHIIPGRLKSIFNDSNHIQLKAAQANGIVPIVDLKSAYMLKKPIQRIHTCNLYYVDSMKHATPYLVPKAALLLNKMAKAFHDTIIARGGKDYRIRVTSMLRTNNSVSALQRRNRAATTQSCHLYGTTFDISWAKFDCMDPSYQISLESLKNILAEIIYDFRQRGQCYAIFENKQGCFHITVR